MENSQSKDYVTEKVYAGLIAGCIPIYVGPPNKAEYLPSNKAVIDWGNVGSEEVLLQKLELLANDPEAYASRLAWKTQDVKQWNTGGLAAAVPQTLTCGRLLVQMARFDSPPLHQHTRTHTRH
jgi:hypothetical protein